MLLYEKKYPEYDTYEGDAWKHEVSVYSLQGPEFIKTSIDFIVRKVIETYAYINGETLIYLTFDEQPPIKYQPAAAIIHPVKITWITHTSPGLALSLPAVASVLAAIGFIILATSTTKFFWTASPEQISKVFEFPKYLLLLILVPMVLTALPQKRK